MRYEREYTLKDHLGNLRLAYRAGHRLTYAATLEQDDHTRQRETHQFDSLSVSPPVAQNVGIGARTGAYAARLNAGGPAPQPLGPLTQLAVQKGDTVTVTAPGYYPQKVQGSGFAFSLASFVASLLQPQPGVPPGADGRRRGALPLLSLGVSATLPALLRPGGGVPQGYARLLVFDADSNLVSSQTRQLSAAANGGYEPLTVQAIVGQDGYVTAYVGNESPVDVYFDDVTVALGQGLQVQETEYDPAGLELAGLAPPSPGLRSLNQYRFNGKEFQADLGLNWNHQDWRFFDPQILRWHVGDPEIENGQESWSPYSFGYDNAVRYGDANGRVPDGPGDPPTTVLPAPSIWREMWRDMTNPDEVKHLLNDLADFPPLAAESGAMNVLRTLAGAATIADHLPAPNTQAAQPTTSAKDDNGRVNANNTNAPTRREQGPSDKTAPSERAARRESFRQNKVPTSKANNFKRENDPDKNPNLRGPKGEPAEKIKTQDGNGNPVTIDHHKNGHEFKDNNTYEQPHYHGPNGKGHLSY